MIVWNDLINLMSYVTFCIAEAFGYSREKATVLRCPASTTRARRSSRAARAEKAEHDVARLHSHGLWATMRQD